MLRPVTGLLLGATLMVAACQSEPATTTSAKTEVTTPAHAAAYVCPMGCEGSESATPGKCPVCEMDLAANPAAAAPAEK